MYREGDKVVFNNRAMVHSYAFIDAVRQGNITEYFVDGIWVTADDIKQYQYPNYMYNS